AAPVHRRLPDDAAEPVVGLRLQPDRRAAGRRGARPDRVRDADGRRGAADERLDSGGGAERAAAASPGPAPGLTAPRKRTCSSIGPRIVARSTSNFIWVGRRARNAGPQRTARRNSLVRSFDGLENITSGFASS